MSIAPQEAGPGKVARAIAGWVEAACASRGRAATILAVAWVLGLASWWFGLSIRVDTDLRALLPASAPSVIALDAIEARKGSAEGLVIAVEAPSAADADAMVEALAAELRTWPETLDVSVARDYTPLRDHALYLLELDELRSLRDELERARKQAVARAMGPGLYEGDEGGDGGGIDVEAVSVGDDWDDPGADSLDWDEGPGPEAPDGAPDGSPDPKADPGRDLDSFMAEQREALIGQGTLAPDEVALIWPEPNEAGELEWRERVGKPYTAEEGRVRTVHASLSIPATDVEFAHDLVARVEAKAESLRAGAVAAETRAEVVGAYNVSGAVNTILADARRATLISVSLVLVVLLLGFRRARALILIAVPMAVAMGLTLTLAKLVYAELNALTVFLFAVLFGMGVDFCVHLFAQRQAQGPIADWGAVVATHLRPLAATMATTAASLAVLGLAEFKAFREFGVISAVGVVLCFVAAVALVPVTDTLLGPLRRGAGAPAPSPARSQDSPARLGRGRIAALVVLAAISIYGAPKLAMEKNTRELNRNDAVAEDGGLRPIPYGSTGGRRKTLALVAEDSASLAVAVARLQEVEAAGELLPGGVELPEVERRPWVAKVYSLETMMPTDQGRKAALIQDIGARTNDFLAELPDLDADAQRYRTQLEALERLAGAAPLTVEGLPVWALAPFRETDGRSDRIAHVELDIVGYHIDELVALRHRLDELLGDTGVLAADSRLVFADLMVAVEHDARRLPVLALAIILVFIALDLRRPGPSAACFAVLVLGLSVVVAIMGLWPLRLNFFNLVVMPGVIGLGIDASIHLWHARAHLGTAATTGRASLIAALTTVAGFSGLCWANHAGLRSIGVLGVTAISVCVAVAFLAMYPSRRA